MDKITKNLMKFLNFIITPIEIDLKKLKKEFDKKDLRDQSLIAFAVFMGLIFLIWMF